MKGVLRNDCPQRLYNTKSPWWWQWKSRQRQQQLHPLRSYRIILSPLDLFLSICMEFDIAKSSKWVQHSNPTHWSLQLQSVFNREAAQQPKEGAHVRHIAVPWRTQFQTADSSLTAFHFTQIWKKKKNTYALSDIVVFLFLLTKLQGKSQGRLWYCIPLLFRYINNQIWGAANKHRINIISILITLQATGHENRARQRAKGIGTCQSHL